VDRFSLPWQRGKRRGELGSSLATEHRLVSSFLPSLEIFTHLAITREVGLEALFDRYTKTRSQYMVRIIVLRLSSASPTAVSRSRFKV
jgi:hypothetical protein